MAKIVGTAELIRKMQRVNKAALGVVNEEALKALLISRVRGRFDQGVAPDGSPWAGLLASTIGRKQRSGVSYPEAPLKASLRLRKSINVVSGASAGLLAGASGLGFRIGVTDPVASQYGRLHNMGLGGQEKRQFIGIGATDVRAVSALLRRRLKSIAEA